MSEHVFDKGIDFEAAASKRKLEAIGGVVLVGSGKGGVGKSLVSCGLALSLAREGYRTGILDIDIHGASVPNYLGVRPPVRSSVKGLEPKKVGGLKVMSLALFTGDNPIPLRGDKKQGLITGLFALTNWGRLDFLVVDLPPSTGDELLTAISLFEGKSRLILVTTPSRTAMKVVERLRTLAEVEKLPVQGVVVNMAYTKAGRGRRAKVTHPFGTLSDELIARKLKSRVLVKVPLEPKVSSEGFIKVMRAENDVSRAFKRLASLVLS